MSIEPIEILVSEDIQEDFIINEREIVANDIESLPENILVTTDHLSNRIYFSMYYTFDDRELESKEISIVWINADDKKGMSLAVDKQLIASQNRLYFAWNVPGTATYKDGIVYYAIRITSTDYVWNSLVGSVEVKQGLITEEYNDLEEAQLTPGWVDYIEGKYEVGIQKIPRADFDALETKNSKVLYLVFEPDDEINQYIGEDWISKGGSDGIGESTTGMQFVVDGTTYTSGAGSERFNDYSTNYPLGRYNHVEGIGNVAGGENDHIEGYHNTSKGSGMGNHVENTNNSCIEGVTSTHIEGNGNIIKSGTSKAHLEGDSNTIQDGSNISHIEGYNNTCMNSSTKCHIEGDTNTVKAVSTQCHIEGYNNTIIACTDSHISGSSNTVTGSTDSQISGKSNIVTNVKQSSVSGSNNTVSDLDCTTVEGNYNTVSKGTALSSMNYNHVGGSGNQLTNGGSGNSVSGVGNTVKNSYDVSVSGNTNTLTSVQYSIVSGYNNSVSSSTSNIVSGDNNTVSNASKSVVVGYENLLSKLDHCYIWGSGNTCSTSGVVYNGYTLINGQDNTVTDGSSNLVSGGDNIVSNTSYSIVGGEDNDVADALQVTVCGYNNDVSECTGTLVSGGNNRATNAIRSIISGDSLVVNPSDSSSGSVSGLAVFGKFNVNDTSGTKILIIGNGGSDTSRSNAFTVDNAGNGVFAGDITFHDNTNPESPVVISLLAKIAELESRLSALES